MAEFRHWYIQLAIRRFCVWSRVFPGGFVKCLRQIPPAEDAAGIRLGRTKKGVFFEGDQPTHPVLEASLRVLSLLSFSPPPNLCAVGLLSEQDRTHQAGQRRPCKNVCSVPSPKRRSGGPCKGGGEAQGPPWDGGGRGRHRPQEPPAPKELRGELSSSTRSDMDQ